MLEVYQALARLAAAEFGDVVTHSTYIGGTTASPNKLRLFLTDTSFLDIWLSAAGDYAYHWEQRRQRGQLYRWDNAPHHPEINTFPAHLHAGEETSVVSSKLPPEPSNALRQVLGYIHQQLSA